MKLKWFLCGIFVYSVVINAAFAEDEFTLSESDEILYDCTVHHLKDKGMIEADVPVLGKASPTVCRFAMTYASGKIRETFEFKMKKEFPEAIDCIMAKYDENHTFDGEMTMGYIENNKALSEDERKTQAANNEKQLNDNMRKTASSCGLDEEKFMKYLEETFGSADETTTVTETV